MPTVSILAICRTRCARTARSRANQAADRTRLAPCSARPRPGGVAPPVRMGQRLRREERETAPQIGTGARELLVGGVPLLVGSGEVTRNRPQTRFNHLLEFLFQSAPLASLSRHDLEEAVGRRPTGRRPVAASKPPGRSPAAIRTIEQACLYSVSEMAGKRHLEEMRFAQTSPGRERERQVQESRPRRPLSSEYLMKTKLHPKDPLPAIVHVGTCTLRQGQPTPAEISADQDGAGSSGGCGSPTSSGVGRRRRGRWSRG